MSNNNSSTKILWIVFLTIFIDMLGIGILIPVFPLLFSPSSIYKVIPINWIDSDSYIIAGWLMASFPLMQFLATPILGQLSDRYGRRKILAFSISGTATSYILFAIGIFTKSLPLLFFSRILDGISGGNISVAQAVIGDISKPQNRAKNFGLIGVAVGLGFVLGPFIGGKLSDPMLSSFFNPATPFCFAACISFINVILVLFFLPETLQIISEKRIYITRPFNNILQAFKSKNLNIIFLALFLFNSGFTFFTTFWGIVLAEKFSFISSSIGNFYAYSGVMIILSQGLIVRRLSGKVADYKVLYYSIFGTGVCLIAYYLIPYNHFPWVYYVPPLMAISVALTKAFSGALLTRITASQIRGEIMGINSSINALAQSIPALLAGYIGAHEASLPILIGGLITILGGVLFILLFKSSK